MLVVDSITKLGPDARGEVAIAASHGGVYPAYLAAAAGLRGVVLHDAGIGLDEAGVGCLAYLDALGIPAATVAHTSARIGDGADLARRGDDQPRERRGRRAGLCRRAARDRVRGATWRRGARRCRAAARARESLRPT